MNYNLEQFIIILSVIILNFYGAKSINTLIKYKKFVFVLFISLNIIVLLCFKYLNFLSSNLSFIFNLEFLKNKNSLLDVFLPVGLSFITFKNISYLIEIYRGNIETENSISKYSLYITFFPTVLAGPIERPNPFMTKLGNLSDGLDLKNLEKGIYFILLGVFQKTVIADRLMPYVNDGFANYLHIYGLGMVLIILFYSIQLYCDFSGYSNIALGSAKLFGIDVMQNFNIPYITKSLSEFWRKWHISLSSWLRDYLFLPVAYFTARKLSKRNFSNKNVENYSYITGIIITMLIAGVWHGANWTFVIWGGMIGLFMVIGFLLRKVRRKIWKKFKVSNNSRIKEFIQVIFTFGTVSFCWIFFKSSNVNQAVSIIKHVFSDFFFFRINIPYNDLIFISVLIILYFAYEFLQYRGIITNTKIFNLNLPLKITIALSLFLFIIIFGYFSSSQFIYFKF